MGSEVLMTDKETLTLSDEALFAKNDNLSIRSNVLPVIRNVLPVNVEALSMSYRARPTDNEAPEALSANSEILAMDDALAMNENRENSESLSNDFFSMNKEVQSVHGEIPPLSVLPVNGEIPPSNIPQATSSPPIKTDAYPGSTSPHPVSPPSQKHYTNLSTMRSRAKNWVISGKEKRPTNPDLHSKLRNYRMYDGRSIFLLGGRFITVRERPFNLLSLLAISIPGGLYFGFIAPWFWHHISAAVPMVFAYLFGLCIFSFARASFSDPGVSIFNIDVYFFSNSRSCLVTLIYLKTALYCLKSIR